MTEPRVFGDVSCVKCGALLLRSEMLYGIEARMTADAVRVNRSGCCGTAVRMSFCVDETPEVKP